MLNCMVTCRSTDKKLCDNKLRSNQSNQCTDHNYFDIRGKSLFPHCESLAYVSSGD